MMQPGAIVPHLNKWPFVQILWGILKISEGKIDGEGKREGEGTF